MCREAGALNACASLQALVCTAAAAAAAAVGHSPSLAPVPMGAWADRKEEGKEEEKEQE